MFLSVYLKILVVDLVSILITFPGYVFILVVNILDWRKNRRLEISDQLISGMALFNLVHRIFYASINCAAFTKGFHAIKHLELFINILYLSLIFCTLLFSTWLAIHFCLKIVTINHNLYIYIQRMFPKIFPWILLPSVLVSILVSAPASLALTHKKYPNSTKSLRNEDQSFVELLVYCALSGLCFLLHLCSALNIIMSLRNHIKQIHDNRSEFRGQVVEAHVSAIKTIVSFLTFNLLYFAVQSCVLIPYVYVWIYVLPFLYALCHILGVPILIRGSSKLQNILRSAYVNCYHKAFGRNSRA